MKRKGFVRKGQWSMKRIVSHVRKRNPWVTINMKVVPWKKGS